MSVKTFSLQFRTRGNGDVQDITDAVAQQVLASELKNGTATLFTPSATSALTTIEYEAGCINDLQRLFDEIVDPNRHYAHNARWHDGNGHSHVRAALLGPSLCVPFVERHLTLGTWQQIIFVDFDNRARQREIVIQLIGE